MDTTWNDSSSQRSGAANAGAAQVVPPPRQAEVAPQAPKKGKAKFVLLGLVGAAILGGGGLYVKGMGTETTDDAQVEGHLMTVSARVPGQVARVLIHDNELVEEGQPLVILDDADLQAKLLAAKADLAQAEANLAAAVAQEKLTERTVQANLKQAKGGIVMASSGFSSVKAQREQAEADVAAAESRKEITALELKRAENLRSTNAVAQAEVDTRKALFDQADAQVAQAKARLSGVGAAQTNTAGSVESAQGRLAQAEAGPEQLDAAKANVGVADAHVKQAEAALKLATLNVGYTVIKAPVKGIVSRRSVEPGQTVSPDRSLMALVPPDDTWIVANFKEDQIGEMKPGQPAKLTIDSFGRKKFTGHVESLAGASGSRFALLPPDNASGNFVKVVQRIPVLIRLDPNQNVQLRPGMSADVAVKVD